MFQIAIGDKLGAVRAHQRSASPHEGAAICFVKRGVDVPNSHW